MAVVVGVDALAGVKCVFYWVLYSIGLEVGPLFDVLGINDEDIELMDVALAVKYLV